MSFDDGTTVVGVTPRIRRKAFAQFLSERNSPAAAEAADGWKVVQEQGVDPLFALAVFQEESHFATDPNTVTVQFQTRSPGNTRTSRLGLGQTVDTQHGQFVKYDSWRDGWHDMAFRLVDPSFVYVQEGRRTIRRIIERFAPPSENNTERYIARVVQFMNDHATTAGDSIDDREEVAVDLSFGNVPHPPHTRDIIHKPEGHGQDNLGPRNNRGVVYHRTLGRSISGTGEFFKLPGTQALTQYGVGAPPPCQAGEDGAIFLWSDPIGNVAPWASGPWNDVPGDGKAFVDKFGVNAINRDLIAIEISGMFDDPISDSTIDAVAAISAFWADQAHIPHDVYPMNPHTGVLYTYFHKEFTNQKICPGPVVVGAIDEIIARTKAIMKRHQTRVTAPEAPLVTGGLVGSGSRD